MKRLLSLLLVATLYGCSANEEATTTTETEAPQETVALADKEDSEQRQKELKENLEARKQERIEAEKEQEETEKAESEDLAASTEETTEDTEETQENQMVDGYKTIKVDGGDLSGQRQAKVRVDIGYGDRQYWAFTNEHGQLVRVVAEEIILQDDNTESTNSDGRYYNDEANVPGVESDTLDQGHVIADSLGGVANAYNITPQDSALNRWGDQAYMEDNIRKAGGATNFEAIITYPNTETQTPSHYQYMYTVQGNTVTDSFDNVDPEQYNEDQGITSSEQEETQPEPEEEPETESIPEQQEEQQGSDITKVDTNGNGTVTISEAEAAGFSMPIKEGHWLYPYMIDRDNDGMVGE